MKKNRIITFCAVALIILCVLFLYGQRRAIFQRGNPIPYLRAASQLSEEHPYVAVDEARGIYISTRGEYLELFEFFQDELDVEFVEQAGSGYIFSNGTKNYVISSEVYWGHYTVWTLPLYKLNTEQGNIHKNTTAKATNSATHKDTTQDLSQVPGAVVHVVDIWDRTKEEHLDCDDALEKFWEDDTTEYYFGCIKSQYIMVMDSTGRTVDIVTALNEGLVTVETLDSYGITYYTEPKS